MKVQTPCKGSPFAEFAEQNPVPFSFVEKVERSESDDEDNDEEGDNDDEDSKAVSTSKLL